jgi:hypothetical protein
MGRDNYQKPEQLSGYTGEQEAPVAGGPPIRTKGLSAAQNRGMRAPREGSGAVIGSGAGAGGGGGGEDYDSDAAGGGGAVRMKSNESHPESGADAPVGGSR